MENLEKTPISTRYSARPLPSLLCDMHDEQIFNFCLNLECLKPLCPECINEHQEFHNEKETKADFTTLRVVKSSCSKKIDAGILSLNQEVKKCELEYLLDPEALIDAGMKRIKKFKERLHMMIESHCNLLEENLKRRVQENLVKGSDFEGIFEEMKNIIAELEFLKKNLETISALTYIKKICMLDLKALMKEFKNKVENVIKNKDLEPIDIHVDETHFAHFKQELENMIFIKKDNKNLDFSAINNDFNNSTSQIRNPLNDNKNDEIVEPHIVNQSPHINKITNVPSIKITESNNMKINNNNNIIHLKNNNNLINNNDNNIVNSPITKLLIEAPSYFLEKSKKLLHFFQRDKQILHVLDLENIKKDINFKKFHINSTIFAFSRSIALPDGNIYLIGGQNFVNSLNKSADISKFSENDLELTHQGKLNIGRSCHSLCVINDYIYIIGGYSKNGLVPQSERFNFLTKKCETIMEPMKFPVASPAVCSFKYAIFKFGGIGANGTISQNIEKLDVKTLIWAVVNYKNPMKLLFLINSTCTQINGSEILIIGGHDIEDQGSNQCLLFEFDDRKIQDSAILKEIDKECLLPNNYGFACNEGIGFDNKIYFIQNKGRNNGSDGDNEDEKNVLILGARGEWSFLK